MVEQAAKNCRIIKWKIYDYKILILRKSIIKFHQTYICPIDRYKSKIKKNEFIVKVVIKINSTYFIYQFYYAYVSFHVKIRDNFFINK